jgi:hypothetical protein
MSALAGAQDAAVQMIDTSIVRVHLATVDRGTAGRKNQSKALQDQIRTVFAGEIGHLEPSCGPTGV